MKKNKNKIVATLSVLIGIIFVYLSANFFLSFFTCQNEVIESINSPEGNKKAVIFTVNCGATTDWIVNASVLNVKSEITDKDSGNVLNIDSNHGSAYPLEFGGRPVIKAVWQSKDVLNLNYSKNSNPRFVAYQVDGVKINFTEISTLTSPKDK